MYRHLTNNEVYMLQSQGCRAETWEMISVNDKTDLHQITNVSFSGKIKIGLLDECFELPGGLRRHSGL